MSNQTVPQRRKYTKQIKQFPLEKQCTHCGKTFPRTFEYFPKATHHRDGLASHCKECVREHRHNWYLANRDEQQAKNREWQKNNPERYRQYIRNWQSRNRAKINEHARIKRSTNPELNRAAVKRYHQSKPIVARMNASKRRAQKKKVACTLTKVEIQEKYKKQRGRCYYCGELLNGVYHVDHVMPLSRGGEHTSDNTVLACPLCNHKKFNRMPHEWPDGGRLC